MIAKLQKKFNTYEQGRLFYTALKSRSNEQLHFKPSEKDWSLFETCAHLLLVDRLSVEKLRAFDFHRKNEKLGFASMFNSYVLSKALRSDRQFKAPKVVTNRMQEGTPDSFENLLAQWNLVRVDLNDYLLHFPKEHTNKFVFAHPRAGKLNIYQTMTFLVDHQFHHLYQINKILQHKNFPLS